MVMGLYACIKHIHLGKGCYWFNANTIPLAKHAYWDAINGVSFTSLDEALSDKAVTQNWWETDDLADEPGKGEEEFPTRPDKGYTREQLAITTNNNKIGP
jgi:hypothetical protein